MRKNAIHYLRYRLLEILPGFLAWSTIVLAVVLSIRYPIAAIYFIVVFDLYWLLRVSYLTIYIIVSWVKYRRADRVDWQERLELECGKSSEMYWNDYWHVIFLPTYQEPFEIISASLNAIVTCAYGQKRKMIIVLAGEERDGKNFAEITRRVTRQFSESFHSIIATTHPRDIQGDLPGKGSNLFYAGHVAQQRIDELGIDYKKMIVSTFDVDTVVHPQYFSYLTYEFLRHPNPYRASFQPLTLYHNNIWESDVITRVVANSTTFWLLTDLARSERLFTFSSHSMSWQALVDVNFWQNNIVTEDSRIFLQCFIHYDGDYTVHPLYIPVSMNTVYVGSFRRSIVNQYKQIRRWAYGVEHFPYMVWRFRGNRRIPFRKKLMYLWNLAEGFYSWSTAPIVIFLVGHIPLMITNATRDASFVSQQTPLLLSGIMTIAMWGIVLIAILSTVMVPHKKMSPFKAVINYLVMLVQWAIFPVTMVLFGSIPALDAQTRLMLGKYLDFWTTEKKHSASLGAKNGRVSVQKVA